MLSNEIICLFEGRYMPTQIFWVTFRTLSLFVLTVGNGVGYLEKVCSMKVGGATPLRPISAIGIRSNLGRVNQRRC